MKITLSNSVCKNSVGNQTNWLLTFLLFVSVPTALAKSSTAWRIDYVTGPMTGGITSVLLSKDAIKIITKSSYCAYAKSPDWTATVCNKKAKVECLVSAAAYKKNGLFTERGESDDFLDPGKAFSRDKITLLGLKSTRRAWRTVRSDEGFYRNRERPRNAVTEVIETSQIPCNTAQVALLSAWFSVPYLQGVPLCLTWRDETGKTGSPFRATSAQLSPSSQTEFRLPSGYKKVRKVNDLLKAQYAPVTDGLLEEVKKFEERKKR